MERHNKQELPITMEGHVLITDDLDNTLLEKHNAVHPQNIARVIARAISNEANYKIHRIAFGNGGTEIDAAFTITFKNPNDGQPPDTQTWESRLYNETYSEIIDENNTALLGTDPGSAGPRVGTRAGGGARPENDPASVEHVSGPGVRSRELGLTSEVVIVAVLNPNEPTGQLTADQSQANNAFTFDELGIYTSGQQARDSAGVQDVDVNDKTSTDLAGLVAASSYDFNITVDSVGPTNVTFTVPAGITPTFGDLCEALNTADPTWNVQGMPSGVTVAITDNTFGVYPSIEGQQTYGYLRFTSGSSGTTSTIRLEPGTSDFFTAISGTIVFPATDGNDKGVQNNAINSDTEQERLLTHLVFSPVLKAADRTLTITYTLTISVARTQS